MTLEELNRFKMETKQAEKTVVTLNALIRAAENMKYLYNATRYKTDFFSKGLAMYAKHMNQVYCKLGTKIALIQMDRCLEHISKLNEEYFQ